MKYLIANWKMNSIDIEEWFKGFNKFFREIKNDVEVIKKKMEDCVEFLVPMKVDVAIGDNFGETI